MIKSIRAFRRRPLVANLAGVVLNTRRGFEICAAARTLPGSRSSGVSSPSGRSHIRRHRTALPEIASEPSPRRPTTFGSDPAQSHTPSRTGTDVDRHRHGRERGRRRSAGSPVLGRAHADARVRHADALAPTGRGADRRTLIRSSRPGHSGARLRTPVRPSCGWTSTSIMTRTSTR